MQTSLKGKVWRFGDDISTNLMMPSSLVLPRRLSEEEAATYCFSVNRPGWTGKLKPGEIIVAGRNFGCGSSRNGARMIQLNGIACILAETVSHVFLRNAINIGLPTLWCKGVHTAFDEGDIAEVDTITREVRNLTKGIILQAEPWPDDTLQAQIFEAGGILPYIQQLTLQPRNKSAKPSTSQL